MGRSPDRRRAARLAVAAVLVLASFAAPTTLAIEAAADDVEELREELNQTREELDLARAQLEEARRDRDSYDAKLEDTTSILLVVLVLLIASYLIFFITAKRNTVMLRELERKTGVTLKDMYSQDRRRRRRG